MKSISKLTVVVLLLVVLSSCATIFGKSSYQVRINSSPASSFVILNDKGIEIEKGNTPQVVTLKSSAGYFKKASYRIKFILNGYEEKIVHIDGKLNGWYIGNILIGGLIGMLIIDPASGAMYKLDTLDVNERLSPTSTTQTPESKSQLQILTLNDVPDHLKKHLVKIK